MYTHFYCRVSDPGVFIGSGLMIMPWFVKKTGRSLIDTYFFSSQCSQKLLLLGNFYPNNYPYYFIRFLVRNPPLDDTTRKSVIELQHKCLVVITLRMIYQKTNQRMLYIKNYSLLPRTQIILIMVLRYPEAGVKRNLGPGPFLYLPFQISKPLEIFNTRQGALLRTSS